jgi:hypothetical protein
MKFYISEKDYSRPNAQIEKSHFKINEETAVRSYKKWFFSNLRQFGEIIPLRERAGRGKLKALLGRQDAISVSVNFFLERDLPQVPHRSLWLTLGSLLFPQLLYNLRYLPTAQVNLVSTHFQLCRLRSWFGRLLPKTVVFSNKIDQDYYTIPDKRQRLIARKKQGIGENTVHIIYAGRWIVTKGICQLIRALDIWPMPNIVLTLVGNIEEQNRLAFSFTRHDTFLRFLHEEMLQLKERPWLRFQQTKEKEGLRDLFWSADLFVNLSIHPDEDFGVTPREAISCGVPVVTTNFCGLKPLAEAMPWKGVDTYPTLSGSRFSLRQFRVLLQRAIRERYLLTAKQYRNFVIEECNPEISRKNLAEAIGYLRERPPEVPLNIKNAERNIKKQLLNSVDDNVFKYFVNARRELPHGAYMYGDAPSHYAFPMVQGIYSAMSSPPKVEKNSKWRGFFRIALWGQESALIEFGFPGPRMRRYKEKLWRHLLKSMHCVEPNEYLIIPKDKEQIAIVQELVDLGYLVSDEY